MTSVNWNSSTLPETHTAPVSPKTAGSAATSASGASGASGAADSKSQPPDEPADTLQLSSTALQELALTGRIALNEQAGNISSDQAAQLNGQTSAIQSQIAADKQANGGTLSSSDAQAIQQLQAQLSQTVYSDAHNGAAAPTDPDVTKAGAREAVQAGRIALNQTAGNLSSDQADQLYSQAGVIRQQIATDQQANGGSLSAADATAINQAQNQLSQQIYDTAHNASSPDAA
jgi:hypothetical protein